LFPSIGYTQLNGVKYRAKKPLDDVLPWPYPSSRPEYEAALIAAIRNRVKKDDRVCVIGGGLGISTVVSAHQAGVEGAVEVFEASEYRVKQLRRTLEINDLNTEVHISHALVGPEIHLNGDLGGGQRQSPSSLPQCDVLVMDCEGSELEILCTYDRTPRTVIVETHGVYGAPASDVGSTLEANGYEVVDRRTENEEMGIYILTANRV
jgi:hypothetical protein